MSAVCDRNVVICHFSGGPGYHAVKKKCTGSCGRDRGRESAIRLIGSRFFIVNAQLVHFPYEARHHARTRGNRGKFSSRRACAEHSRAPARALGQFLHVRPVRRTRAQGYHLQNNFVRYDLLILWRAWVLYS